MKFLVVTLSHSPCRESSGLGSALEHSYVMGVDDAHDGDTDAKKSKQ